MNVMCFIQMCPFTSYCDVSGESVYCGETVMMTMLTHQRGDFTHSPHLDVTPVLGGGGVQGGRMREDTEPHSPNLIPIRSKRLETTVR